VIFYGLRAWLFLSAVVLVAGCASAEVAVSGRVLDEHSLAIPDVELKVTSASDSKVVITGSTDSTGSFTLKLNASGQYLLNASKDGFFEIRNYQLTITESSAELLLRMNPVREVFQSLDVNGTPSPVDLDQAGTEERLSGTDINAIPFPSTDNLRNALRLMPGAVQDPQGQLHFQGGAEWQTNYLLEGFRIGDPIDGTFTARIGVEGVQTAEFLGGNFSPEYGYGSAGVLQVRIEPGSNTLRYSATNFVPGVDTRYKLHIGDWSPRAAVSGPILRDRAWFSDNMDGTWSQAYVPGLPAGANFSHQWSISNHLHTQWNLTPSDVLFTDFMANFHNVTYAGLAPLNPIPTTQDQRYRQWLFAVKDQKTFSHGVVVELGFAQQNVYRRMVPMGDQPYIITPLGAEGNYFVNSTQTARRDQLMLNNFLPTLHWLGSHQFKVGAEAFFTRYNGLFDRTSFEHVNLQNQLLSRTTFVGRGQFGLPNTTSGTYLMDQWKPWERVLVTLGVRQDWDDLIDRSTWSPRLSVSAAPFRSTRTRVSAGFAVTVDGSNLQQFSQALDQISVTTNFDTNGNPQGLPVVQVYTLPNRLAAPRYNNWTAGVSQDLRHNLFFTARYLDKRGNHALTYAYSALPDPALDQHIQELVGTPANIDLYTLSNLRRDHYDLAEFTLHQTFAGQFEWMASYTRSHAVSNAVFTQSIDLPQNVLNNYGPLPWDAPNRFINWAYFPLPWKKWAIAYLIDLRSGFPYSIQDDLGNIIGPVDSHRFPTNFDFNLHVERRFEFHGHRFALRVGANNLTDHKNPTAVYNTIGTPQFGQFIGPEGRHFTVRIRFFGKGR
jgi:Carboxypeptidase regulatory-like domain